MVLFRHKTFNNKENRILIFFGFKAIFVASYIVLSRYAVLYYPAKFLLGWKLPGTVIDEFRLTCELRPTPRTCYHLLLCVDPQMLFQMRHVPI